MKQYKTHLLVQWGTRSAILCETKNAHRLSAVRAQVDCRICLHMAREYGDKHMIPQPSPELFFHGDMKSRRLRLDVGNVAGAFHDIQIDPGVIVVGSMQKAPEYLAEPTPWPNHGKQFFSWQSGRYRK